MADVLMILLFIIPWADKLLSLKDIKKNDPQRISHTDRE
jgi:hypothetical protein